MVLVISWQQIEFCCLRQSKKVQEVTLVSLKMLGAQGIYIR